MIVKVSESSLHIDVSEYVVDNEYDLDIPDEKIIDKITITKKCPTYWYALIDGKLFKSDQEKGLRSIFFLSKENI